jgi:hypothetical protein
MGIAAILNSKKNPSTRDKGYLIRIDGLLMSNVEKGPVLSNFEPVSTHLLTESYVPLVEKSQ